MIARERVLPQLHDGIRETPGARIDEPDRFHRAKPQSVDTTVRHHLDRQASLKKLRLVEIVDGGGFGMCQRVVKPLVLVARQRTIQIVAFTVVETAAGARRKTAEASI